MHQKDYSIIERSNIQTDVVVINQCDFDKREVFTFTNKKGVECHAIFISTTERGLSKSRNMAIQNASADLCLICDDDEILSDDYSDRIKNAFRDGNADIIAFQIENSGKTFPTEMKRIGYIGALRLASWQLAFRRKSITANKINFDITLGSGVSKAGGEENKFVYDCLKCRLNVIYLPIVIGRMIENESKWFFGFTNEYFHDRGIMTKKLMGRFYASLYALYFLIRKYPLYKDDTSFLGATSSLYKGILEK